MKVPSIPAMGEVHRSSHSRRYEAVAPGFDELGTAACQANAGVIYHIISDSLFQIIPLRLGQFVSQYTVFVDTD